MAIRSRIRLFAGIFFSVAVLVVLGYGFVIQPMKSSFQKLVFSIEFRGDLFALSTLQHDYLDHHSARAATQWKILADRSISRLHDQRDWSASELEIIQKMKDAQDSMYSIVRNFVLSGVLDPNATQEFSNILNQIESLNQQLIDDVNALSRLVMAHMLASIDLNTPIFFGLILLLVVVGFILLGFLQYTVIGPMSRLEMYTRSILQAQADQGMDQGLLLRRDEVGSLARALKEMHQKIQDAHAELDQRVRERTEDLEAVRLKAEAHATTAERLNRLTIGRELKMLELKKEIQRLKSEQEKMK